jgi:RNA polymerase sigma-70 factor (ECF subfamily)
VRTEARRWLDDVKESLELPDRSLLILRVEQGLAWREVAAVMAEAGDPIEAAALKKRFERLKTRLRELARARGIAGG